MGILSSENRAFTEANLLPAILTFWQTFNYQIIHFSNFGVRSLGVKSGSDADN